MSEENKKTPPTISVKMGEDEKKILPTTNVKSRGVFKLDVEDTHLGVPVWYVLKIKNNQIRMMAERGYKPQKNDEIYKNLTENSIKSYLKSISPETMKSHMSMVYTLKDDTERTYIDNKDLGDNCFVFYPEFSLNPDQTKIKEESGPMMKDIFKLIDLRWEGEGKNLVVYASKKIYGDVMQKMGGTEKNGKWTFSSPDMIVSFLEKTNRESYIKRIIIISYAGIRTNTKRTLEKNAEYHFEEFSYTDMSYIPIDHVYSNKYTKLTPDQWKLIKKESSMTNTNISKIFTTDPVSRYYGATIGTVFREDIKNMVPTSIITNKYVGVGYRIVIKDPINL